MKKVTVKEFFESKEKLFVHVPTLEYSNKLCKAFGETCYKWYDYVSYDNINHWESYKEYTCYTNGNNYSDFAYLTKLDHIQIEIILEEQEPKKKVIDEIGKEEVYNRESSVNVCRKCYNHKYKKDSCYCCACSECEFNTFGGVVEYLNSEVVTPKIKLTQFEYDFLSTIENKAKFCDNQRNTRMKEKGYFKDIDVTIKVKDILENSEVVE